MKLSKVSSFLRRFQHPCRGSWQFRCDPSCWSSGVVRPRVARPRSNSQVRRHIRPNNHLIGRGDQISRSWSTWHHLRPRFSVLLYTHTVICSQAIRCSNKFASRWRGVDRPDRLSSKQSGTVLSAVLLHLRTQSICLQSRAYHPTINNIADRFAPVPSVQSMQVVSIGLSYPIFAFFVKMADVRALVDSSFNRGRFSGNFKLWHVSLTSLVFEL